MTPFANQLVNLFASALLLIASFTFLLARPITQVSASIQALGEGQFGQSVSRAPKNAAAVTANAMAASASCPIPET